MHIHTHIYLNVHLPDLVASSEANCFCTEFLSKEHLNLVEGSN